MKTKRKIKVVISDNIKREAVLIDPSIGVSGEAEDNNVVATGVSAAALAKKLYGRR